MLFADGMSRLEFDCGAAFLEELPSDTGCPDNGRVVAAWDCKEAVELTAGADDKVGVAVIKRNWLNKSAEGALVGDCNTLLICCRKKNGQLNMQQ